MKECVVTAMQATTNDAYVAFKKAILENVKEKSVNQIVYNVKQTVNLFDLFLFTLPEGEIRNHYNCNACKNFFNRYGWLATINGNYSLQSLMFSVEGDFGIFNDAVRVCRKYVEQSAIEEVFFTDLPKLGTPVTGEWSHFYAEVPTQCKYQPTRLKSLDAKIADHREKFNMLNTSMQTYDENHAMKAYTSLKDGLLNLSEKYVESAEYFLQLKRDVKKYENDMQKLTNFLWQKSANAPKIGSTMLGFLLKDIKDGLSFAQIKSRFDAQTAADVYMRAQVAPSVGNIQQAERIIDELGVKSSLDRRYATLEDLHLLWKGPEWSTRSSGTDAKEGIFAGIEPKKKSKKVETVATTDAPASKMAWDKFQRTVLPNAREVYAKVPTNGSRFVALVTALNPMSPPILRWDSLENRNPVSWYYQGGMDAIIRDRLIKNKGKFENASIRASLIWHNRNDLDLHMDLPNGQHIYFGNKLASYGELDVDKNVHGETTEPVENIVFPKNLAREGQYRVYVQNFNFHERNLKPTEFKVELEIDGELHSVEGIISPRGETRGASDITVFTFNYKKDGKSRIEFALPGANRVASHGGTIWNLETNSFVRVNGIAYSPNMWNEPQMPQFGKHVFFLLQNCKDDESGKGRAFFAEALKSDFHPIRSTLEAFTAQKEIEGIAEASACGLGFKEGSHGWQDAILKVVDNNGATSLYALDRWD